MLLHLEDILPKSLQPDLTDQNTWNVIAAQADSSPHEIPRNESDEDIAIVLEHFPLNDVVNPIPCSCGVLKGEERKSFSVWGNYTFHRVYRVRNGERFSGPCSPIYSI